MKQTILDWLLIIAALIAGIFAMQAAHSKEKPREQWAPSGFTITVSGNKTCYKVPNGTVTCLPGMSEPKQKRVKK